MTTGLTPGQSPGAAAPRRQILVVRLHSRFFKHARNPITASTDLIPTAAVPYASMLVAAVAFAAMGSLAHALGGSCNWQVVALARTGLARVFATALTKTAGPRLVFLTPRTLWVRSLAGSVSLVCTFFALARLPVAEVLTLTNVFPIWVALLSWPVLGERPTKEAWIAIAVGLTGVV